MDRNFKNLLEAKSFLAEVCEKDEWVETPLKEVKVLSVPDCPICATCLPEEEDMEKRARMKACSEEDLLRAMEGTKLLLSFNDKDDRLCTVPVNEVAYETMLARAGLAGAAMKAFPPETKEFVLNEAFELWSRASIILVRDGEVNAMHSQKDYEPFRQDNLLGMLINYLEDSGYGYELLEGSVTTRKSIFRVELKNDSLVREIKDTLASIKDNSLKNATPVLVYATSDVQVSGANLFAYVKATGSAGNTVMMRVGKPLLLPHLKGKTEEMFKENLGQTFQMFRTGAEMVSKMISQKVYYPGCMFKKLAKKAGIANGIAVKYAEENIVPGISYNAYDIYFALWECLANTKSQSVEGRLMAEEAIARVANYDFTKYDSPIELEE